jgi:hypothetical protein
MASEAVEKGGEWQRRRRAAAATEEEGEESGGCGDLFGCNYD